MKKWFVDVTAAETQFERREIVAAEEGDSSIGTQAVIRLHELKLPHAVISECDVNRMIATDVRSCDRPRRRKEIGHGFEIAIPLAH